MQYPLELKFKVLALAPQISVTDAGGQQIFYVKQKLFKLKEAVTVFARASATIRRLWKKTPFREGLMRLWGASPVI